MATVKEIDEAWLEARLALLERITRDTKGEAGAESLVKMAEAYAWLTSANQSH